MIVKKKLDELFVKKIGRFFLSAGAQDTFNILRTQLDNVVVGKMKTFR